MKEAPSLHQDPQHPLRMAGERHVTRRLHKQGRMLLQVQHNGRGSYRCCRRAGTRLVATPACPAGQTKRVQHGRHVILHSRGQNVRLPCRRSGPHTIQLLDHTVQPVQPCHAISRGYMLPCQQKAHVLCDREPASPLLVAALSIADESVPAAADDTTPTNPYP